MKNNETFTILRTYYNQSFPQAEFRVAHIADESKDFGFRRQLQMKLAGEQNWRMTNRDSVADLFRENREVLDYLDRAE